MLEALFLGNTLAVVLVGAFPEHHRITLKQVSLLLALKLFMISVYLFHSYEAPYLWGSLYVDSLALSLIVLTTLLVLLSIAISLESKDFQRYAFAFFFLELCLLVVWCVADLFWFYIAFEAILVPMFGIVLYWGSGHQRVWASTLLFMYTVIGSMPMLLMVLFVYNRLGATELWLLQGPLLPFHGEEEKILWFALFISFAVKVPMFPFHLWLPYVHVLAPTAGSVLLAGVLLKLGTYGMLRFLVPLFPLAGHYFTPLVHVLGICGIVYCSLTALRQNDLKRVIAYSSIAHMGLLVIGIYSPSIYALLGSLYQMISHGLVASLLFMLIGMLYDRAGSRLIAHFGGLATVIPRFATAFLLGTLLNMAFPASSNFMGEVLLFIGLFKTNPAAALLAATGIFLVATYSMFLYNRVVFGSLSPALTHYREVDSLDLALVRTLLAGSLGLGLFPTVLTALPYLDLLMLGTIASVVEW